MLYYSDPTLTVENVMAVLLHCQPRDLVTSILPRVQLENEFDTQEDCWREGASYYIQYHPGASWIDLATTLYWDLTELTFYHKMVKPYLPMKGVYIGMTMRILQH